MAILEEMEAGGQLLAELPDDTDDAHFVPAPCQIACPVGTDAPSYIAYILGAALRGGVRGDHGDQSIQFDLRAGVRCAVRAGVPADGFRRPCADPQPEALRHGRGGSRLRPAAGAGAPRAERRGGGLGPCGPDGGPRPLGRGLQGACLRDDRPARRHDDLGHSCVSAAARDHPGGYRPHGSPLPRDGGSPRTPARGGT